MKFTVLCIVSLAAYAVVAASPVQEREKRQVLGDLGNPVVAAALIFGYMGQQLGKSALNLLEGVKDFVLHPVSTSEAITEGRLRSLVRYEIDLAMDSKLLSDGEAVAITVTFDSTWHHPNDNDMKNDQSVDYLQLKGDAATAEQYRKALKEIVALKQSGAGYVKCLYKVHGATIDFLVGNGVINRVGGLLLKKLTGA